MTFLFFSFYKWLEVSGVFILYPFLISGVSKESYLQARKGRKTYTFTCSEKFYVVSLKLHTVYWLTLLLNIELIRGCVTNALDSRMSLQGLACFLNLLVQILKIDFNTTIKVLFVFSTTHVQQVYSKGCINFSKYWNFKKMLNLQ